jgi:hypothetical protein
VCVIRATHPSSASKTEAIKMAHAARSKSEFSEAMIE